MRHPASEKASAVFHGVLAGIGIAHIVLGIVMAAFHAISATRHWRDRK